MNKLTHNWGRFSARGSDSFEVKVTQKLSELCDSLEQLLSPKDYRCLILLGGYGRGEGGVICENGQEAPHNNFDLMLLTENINEEKQQKLNKSIRNFLDDFEEQNPNFSLDCSLMDAHKLKTAPCLIMWYDMKNGHKTLLGDDKFIDDIPQFSLKNIPTWDAKNLLINRGTLLLINDLILHSETLKETQKRLIIKHAMKAIIGYGDTLLFFHGQYHWSYLEKLKRIKELQPIDFKFRQLYQEAAEFRLKADYESYLNRDLKQWMEDLRKLLGPIMLECERMRLKDPQVTWQNYLEKATAAALIDDISLKGIARKIRNLSVHEKASKELPAFSSFGFKSMNHTARLALFFPLAAYRLNDRPYHKKACLFFEKGELSIKTLCQEYLRYWGTYVDKNFQNVISKYGIQL